METNNYAEMTVVDLKEVARKRDVKLPYNATKDEIIEELKKADKTQGHKASDPEQKSKATAPARKSGEETRSFQIGSDPNQREDLTKEEAKAKGFFWSDIDPKQAGRTGMRTAPPAHEVAK